ncbi:MAG: hypothetical protein M3Y64_05400, partial [Gemmatimonadota bacterium]|nr:hypothetical protein [Gemmatimonadota bacterium]
MTTSSIPDRDLTSADPFLMPRGMAGVAAGATALLFGILFAHPAVLLADAWWNDPNSGHGLL